MSERSVIALDEIRADGWFEKLAEGTGNFQQLCDIVGERCVAFSILAGVRITAINYDPGRPDGSLVDFVVGEEEEHRLALGEFRRRVASSLLAEDEPAVSEFPDATDPESLQAFIGTRYVLLAPIFGLTLQQLQIGGGRPPTVEVVVGGSSQEITVEELRDVIREGIRNELHKARSGSPFSIDLEVVSHAQQANAEQDWERTIELLGAWPGALSMLLRTAEAQQLGADVRATLAHALALLGTAYARTERPQWAEDVMRLGIQWSQHGAVAGDLFRRLGESYAESGREGEAIGILRRALMLGTTPREVLPTLARCYAQRKRFVAAMVCVDEAMVAGAPPAAVEAPRRQAEAALGSAWERFRQQVPRPDCRGDTTRPPRTRAAEGAQTGLAGDGRFDDLPPREPRPEGGIADGNSADSSESESWETD